jgi:ATP-dependent Clp protease ATP-binding subunit ClpA
VYICCVGRRFPDKAIDLMDEACTTVEHLGGENPVVAPDHVAQVGMCPLLFQQKECACF